MPKPETIQRAYLYRHLRRMQAKPPPWYDRGEIGDANYYFGRGWRAAMKHVRLWLKGEVSRTQQKGGIGR